MKPIKKVKKIMKAWKRKISSFFWLNDCAGGICIRERKWIRELLCVLHNDGGFMLPKWWIKKWESFEEAALREFREETGMNHPAIVEKIGVIYDKIRRKKIVFFLMQYRESSHSTLRDEATMWIDLEKSSRKMKHKSEQEFIEKYLLWTKN